MLETHMTITLELRVRISGKEMPAEPDVGISCGYIEDLTVEAVVDDNDNSVIPEGEAVPAWLERIAIAQAGDYMTEALWEVR